MEETNVEEERDIEGEMRLIGLLTNSTTTDQLVAMYYRSLNVIATQADMSVIDVHNEVIVGALNEFAEEVVEIEDYDGGLH